VEVCRLVAPPVVLYVQADVTLPDGRCPACCRPRVGYACAMTDRPIEDELRELAEEIVAGPDDVAEFAAIHAETYRVRRAVIIGMLHVDAMIAEEDRGIDEQHPQLVVLREDLRNRLRGLLAWAKETGRM